MRASATEILVGISVILCVLAVVVFGLIVPLATVDHVTLTVKHKERIVRGSGEHIHSKYLVFTDGEVFEDVDTMLFWKFDSSDIYGHLNEGQTYRAKVNGWRIPFLSAYRNIITIE